MNNMIRIGEMSKSFQISIDTLRYYDKIGLLKPYVDPTNNYRYYSPEQIIFLKMIMLGKYTGIPLKELKETYSSDNIGEYYKLMEHANNHLKEQKKEIEKQIDYTSSMLEIFKRITELEKTQAGNESPEMKSTEKKQVADLKIYKKEKINKKIYTIALTELHSIPVSPNSIEEAAGVEQWEIYHLHKNLEAMSPEGREYQSFGYSSDITAEKYEPPMKEKVKLGKAVCRHCSGTYYTTEFWGSNAEIVAHIEKFAKELQVKEDAEILIKYEFSLLNENMSHRHLVRVYVEA